MWYYIQSVTISPFLNISSMQTLQMVLRHPCQLYIKDWCSWITSVGRVGVGWSTLHSFCGIPRRCHATENFTYFSKYILKNQSVLHISPQVIMGIPSAALMDKRSLCFIVVCFYLRKTRYSIIKCPLVSSEIERLWINIPEHTHITLHNCDTVSVHCNHFYCIEICDKLNKHLHMLTYIYLNVDECWLISSMH